MHDSDVSPVVGADLIKSLMPVARFIESRSSAIVVAGKEFELVKKTLDDVFPSVFSIYAKEIKNGADLVTVSDLLGITEQLDLADLIAKEYSPALSQAERESKIELFDNALKRASLGIESNQFFRRYSKFTTECCATAIYLSYNLTFLEQVEDLNAATEAITEASLLDLLESIARGEPFSENCEKVMSGLMLSESLSQSHNDALKCIYGAMRTLEAFRDSER